MNNNINNFFLKGQIDFNNNKKLQHIIIFTKRSNMLRTIVFYNLNYATHTHTPYKVYEVNL